MSRNLLRFLRPSLVAFLFLPSAVPQVRARHGLTITSTDGELKAVLPIDWERADLHVPGAEILAANNSKHMYVAVSSTQRADAVGTLEDYASSNVPIATRRLLDVTLVESRHIEIRGQQCVQYQIHGTLPQAQIRIGYLLTFLETEHHYIQVTGWTTESRFENNLDELSRIAESIVETKTDAQ